MKNRANLTPAKLSDCNEGQTLHYGGKAWIVITGATFDSVAGTFLVSLVRDNEACFHAEVKSCSVAV